MEEEIKTSLHKSSCVCGNYSIELKGNPQRITICHCYACQQRTGSVFGCQARFLKDQVIDQKGIYTSYSRKGDSGSIITYNFCPTCGSTISYTFDSLPDVIVITVGSLQDSSMGSPILSVYESRKHPWVQLPDNIEHWD